MPEVKVLAVEHVSGRGLVGIIEVRRGATKVPHRIKKTGGKIAVGTIYVRHGSQVEPATPDEEIALIEEGDAARAAS